LEAPEESAPVSVSARILAAVVARVPESVLRQAAAAGWVSALAHLLAAVAASVRAPAFRLAATAALAAEQVYPPEGAMAPAPV
jgi:hypothetical protein